MKRPDTASNDSTGKIARSPGGRSTQRKDGSEECSFDKSSLSYLFAG